MQLNNAGSFQELYEQISRYFASYIRSLLKGKFWWFKAAIICQVFALVVSFPSYELFFTPNDIVGNNWAHLNQQFLHPLTQQHAPPEEHYGQIGLRLTLPIISYLFHLRVPFWLFVQPVLGIAFIALVIKRFEQVVASRTLAFAVGLSLSACYVGKAFLVDVIGYFDGMAFFFLLVAMLAPTVWLVGLAALCALFVDERVYFAMPLLMLWWQLQGSGKEIKVWPWQPQTSIILCTTFFSFVVRYVVGHHFDLFPLSMGSEYIGMHVLRSNYQSLPLLLLFSLDSGWLLLLIITPYLILKTGKIWAAIYVIYLLTTISAFLLVLDVTRAGAYLFPGVLCGIVLVSKFESTTFKRNAIVGMLLLNLFLPPVFSVGNTHVWMGPIFPKILRLSVQYLLHVSL